MWVWACPPGVVAAPDMTNAGCAIVDPLASGLGLSITGPALASPLSMADTVPADAGARAWEGVPYGDYTLTATLPAGYDGYAVRSQRSDFPVRLLSGGTGYAFTISANLFDPSEDYHRVNIDVYLLRS